MSLLLDALKRAEEAKRQAGQPGASPARDSSREAESLTLAPKDEDKSPLPDLNSHLDSVDQDLRAEAAVSERPAVRAAPPQLQKPGGGAAQAAARNVFAAKPPAAQAKPKAMLIASIAGGIAAMGIVGYFGYQYLQLTGMLAPTPQTATKPASATGRAPGAAGSIAAAPLPSSSAPLPAQSMPAQAKPAAKPAAGTAAPTTQSSARPEPRPRAVPTTGAREPNPVRVSTAPKIVDSRLAAAYAALQSGQLAAADAGYRDVLAREPGNIDALLGIAVIAARAGRFEDAQAAYLKVLEAAPRNAAAQAGLLSLSNAVPAAERESRLKQLLVTPPSDPTLAGLLHFALGNVYVDQQRWAEAQAAYFDASVTDRDNPDYLYNLAVSLEHLQKPALAARQYEAAVRAASLRPFGFDLDAARARAAALTR